MAESVSVVGGFELSSCIFVGSVSSLAEDSDEFSDEEFVTGSVIFSTFSLLASSETLSDVVDDSDSVAVDDDDEAAVSHWAFGDKGTVLSAFSPAAVALLSANNGVSGTATSTTGVKATAAVVVVVAASVAAAEHIVASGVMELDGDFAWLIIWPNIVGPLSCTLVDVDDSLSSLLPAVAVSTDCTTVELTVDWKLCCGDDNTDVGLPFTSDFLLSDLTPGNMFVLI